MVSQLLQRLDSAFPFASNAPLQRDLKRLMTALEARFSRLESVSGTFEDEVSKFEALGLNRLNDVLTPLASEAVNRLQDITQLFGATSATSTTIELGTKQFLIPVDQRNTYVPTPYIAIFAVGEEEQGMIAQRVSFDRSVGILTVDVQAVTGSGTYNNWQLSVSPSLSLRGYTQGETDTAIGAAIAALDAVFALKAPLASPTFTGTPIAPTQVSSNDSTRIATTAFVNTVATIIASAIVDDAINQIVIPPAPVDVASVAQVRGATSGIHAITTPLIETASVTVALTDGANISLDWKTGINFTVTLGGNRTLSNPSNGIPGTWRTVLVTQDSNGTRTLAYGNQYVAPNGTKPVIGTGANKTSRITIYCRTTSVFEVYSTGMGFA